MDWISGCSRRHKRHAGEQYRVGMRWRPASLFRGGPKEDAPGEGEAAGVRCSNVAVAFKRTMATKTALVLGAVTVLLLTGCAADVQQQRHSNAAMEQIKERRDACYADAALSIDDGVSDARTVGQAVSARCRKYTDELIRVTPSRDPKGSSSVDQEADEMATTYVIEFRRLKKVPG
jgi:hypothetical protein